MIDYSPLWITMKEKNISQYYLLQHGIDNRVLDALKKNRNITIEIQMKSRGCCVRVRTGFLLDNGVLYISLYAGKQSAG